MSNIVIPLENTLKIWEDFCFLKNLKVKIQMRIGKTPDFQLFGPFLHFAKLRKELLTSYENFDMDKFADNFLEDRFTGKPLQLNDMAEIPFELALWIDSSRRVYHLKSDACYLLNATHTKNITWQNVKFPFDAFAIMLDEPIIGTNFHEEYDCILVSTHNSGGVTILSLRLINSKIKNYIAIPENEKKLMESFYHKEKFHQLESKLNKFLEAIPDPLILPHFELPLTPEILAAKVSQPIEDLILQFAESQNKLGHKIQVPAKARILPEEGNTATRITVALCLFLTTRHAKNIRNYTYRTPWQEKKQSITTISDEADIFKVTLGEVISHQEKQSFSQGITHEHGYTVNPHFREGTFRFPPYKANDPEAEKTIWVRPSIINAHLIPNGHLPNGTKVKIK